MKSRQVRVYSFVISDQTMAKVPKRPIVVMTPGIYRLPPQRMTPPLPRKATPPRPRRPPQRPRWPPQRPRQSSTKPGMLDAPLPRNRERKNAKKSGTAAVIQKWIWWRPSACEKRRISASKLPLHMSILWSRIRCPGMLVMKLWIWLVLYRYVLYCTYILICSATSKTVWLLFWYSC